MQTEEVKVDNYYCVRKIVGWRNRIDLRLWAGNCDEMLEWKVAQIFPKDAQIVATAVLLLVGRVVFSKYNKNSPKITATFVRKCVANIFQKSPNLVTLVVAQLADRSLLTPRVHGLNQSSANFYIKSINTLPTVFGFLLKQMQALSPFKIIAILKQSFSKFLFD